MTMQESPDGRQDQGHDTDAATVEARITDVISEFSEFFAAARSNWARYSEEVHPELTGAGMIIMQFIVRNGPVTATGICQIMRMDKALVSRQVARLRELGFVHATPAEEDRRVMLLTPSDEAKRVMGLVKAKWAHSYHDRFADWDIEEIERFRAALHRFNTSADREVNGPAGRCAKDRHTPA